MRFKIRQIDKDRFYFIDYLDKNNTGYYGLKSLKRLMDRLGIELV